MTGPLAAAADRLAHGPLASPGDIDDTDLCHFFCIVFCASHGGRFNRVHLLHSGGTNGAVNVQVRSD